MKRFLISIAFLLLMTGCANGETQIEQQALDCIILSHPGYTVLAADQWGSSAAAVMGKADIRILCVAEKRENGWKTVVSNASALPKGVTPSLFMDTDTSLFWSYTDERYHYSFSSYQTKDGWMAPSCIRSDHLAGENGLYIETEHVLKDGFLSFRTSLWDENENLQTTSQAGPYPAKWLNPYNTLSTFDCSLFPTAEKVTDISYLNREALQKCAAEFAPEYTFVAGAATKKGLELLMQETDGTLRFITWTHSENGSLTNISAPLPEGTCYGYENFDNCLWLPGGIVIDAQPYADGVWHINDLFSDGPDSRFLFLGRNWISEDHRQPARFYIGDHPWQTLSMNVDSLPFTLEDALDQLNPGRWAVVNNPDPHDRLHLRESANQASLSYGKFYNGTPVEVLQKGDTWCRVRIPSGFTGWMMTKYLAFEKDGWEVENAFPILHFVDGKEIFPVWREEYVLLQKRTAVQGDWMVEKGERCCIIGVLGEEWYHVWFPALDEGGMMRQSDFWPGNG